MCVCSDDLEPIKTWWFVCGDGLAVVGYCDLAAVHLVRDLIFLRCPFDMILFPPWLALDVARLG